MFTNGIRMLIGSVPGASRDENRSMTLVGCSGVASRSAQQPARISLSPLVILKPFGWCGSKPPVFAIGALADGLLLASA